MTSSGETECTHLRDFCRKTVRDDLHVPEVQAWMWSTIATAPPSERPAGGSVRTVIPAFAEVRGTTRAGAYFFLDATCLAVAAACFRRVSWSTLTCL
jgi:hypothetical protein